MKNQWIGFAKKHGVLFLLFIVLSYAYFPYVLQGQKIVQSDIVQSLSMQGEIKRFLAQDEYILWINNMFSGMPAAQIWQYPHSNFIGNTVDFLPTIFGDPAYFLIAALLGIYVFCLILGIHRWLAALAAIGFAFSSFFLISIEAGHTSKAFGMTLVGPFLASIILLLRGNLYSGFLLTAFFLLLQIRTNHMQITYYAGLIASLIVGFEGIRHIRIKAVSVFFKKIGLLVMAGILALACNASLLWSTYDYAQNTIRGKGSELSEKAAQTQRGGLDKDYAFAWSQGILESFTFLIPNFSGGGSGESLSTNSETYKTLVKRGVSAAQAKNIIQRVPTYWGNQPFTSGPIYFGAAMLFLFLFGFLISKNSVKWVLLACVLLALFLSWGKNFSLLSYFFFDYVPMYNKFRTPAMLVSIPMMLLPIIAALGIHELQNDNRDTSFLLKKLKISGGIGLGICLFFWLGSSLLAYSPNPNLNSTDTQYYENYKQAADESFAQSMLSALKKDREEMLRSDALRSILFIALALALLYFFIQKKITFLWLSVGLGLVVLVDLWGVDKRYLNKENFIDASNYERIFKPRQVDLQILQDPDIHFRTHDLTADPFNSAAASRHLKTIGGYHAAKLQRYQDLIERHIKNGNMNVLNMLNTKYFIVKNKEGQATVQNNIGALGNAWAVSKVQWVANADEEINALADLNPDSVVVIDQRYQTELGAQSELNNTDAAITLRSYHPDKMVYQFESASSQFVVFSEIFYNGNKDWISYIDGQKTNHQRVNYVLRGMSVPAGKHEIVFEYRPFSYYAGEKISLAGNLLLLGLAGIYFFKRRKKNNLAS